MTISIAALTLLAASCGPPVCGDRPDPILFQVEDGASPGDECRLTADGGSHDGCRFLSRTGDTVVYRYVFEGREYEAVYKVVGTSTRPF